MKKTVTTLILIVEFLILGVCTQRVMALSGVSHDDVKNAITDISVKIPVYETEIKESVLSEIGVGTDQAYADLDFDTRFYPYYGMLNDDEKSLYKQIYYATYNSEEEIHPCVNITSDSAENVMNAVMYDHPEIFWIGSGYQFGYTLDGRFSLITFSYVFDGENLNTAKMNVDMVANDIINGALNYSTDLEKERYVHDRIEEIADYNDYNVFEGQNMYSALVGGKTVCAGYSRAFQYIMTRIGIPTYYCVGYSGGDHAWNITLVDGAYYNVDLTWDDTGNTYWYFNCSDEEIASTHTRQGASLNLPACTTSGSSSNEVGSPDSSQMIPWTPAPYEPEVQYEGDNTWMYSQPNSGNVIFF